LYAFREDQQNRVLVPAKQTSSLHLTLSKIAASLLFIAGVETTNAQVKKYETTAVAEVTPVKAKTPARSVSKNKPLASGKTVIRGYIRDSTSLSILPHATVFLKGANINVQADSNGYFQLPIPNRFLKNNLTLIVAAEWYLNKTFIISSKEFVSKKDFYLVQREMLTVTAIKRPLIKNITSGGGTIERVDDKADKSENGSKRKWWPFGKKK
jgi:hypothetical protein